VSHELTEQQRLIRASVREIAEKHFKPKAQEVDRTRRPPVENLKILAENGFSGVFIPEQYGGPGLGLLEIVLIVEQVARCCANTAILIGCTDGATPRAIFHLGTEKQKRELLPRIVRGELPCAWGMSEPNAGSDIASLQCRAVLDGDSYVINGNKLWCSCAQVSDLFLVLVRFDGIPGMKGVGALLVPRDAPGFSVGKHIDLLGFRGTGMAELVFENCRVPRENLILPAGRMRSLLEVFNSDRIATNPPICLGVAQAAFEAAVDYAKQRVQFGKPIAEQQGIQWKLADMAIDLEAGRALLYRAAARVDNGTPSAIDASITKTFVNEMSRRVTDQAMQIFGTIGLSEELPMQRMVRDVRGMSLGYGTTEIHRNLIAKEILDGRYSEV
jgi:butyryl-CoA dehydrogenase